MVLLGIPAAPVRSALSATGRLYNVHRKRYPAGYGKISMWQSMAARNDFPEATGPLAQNAKGRGLRRLEFSFTIPAGWNMPIAAYQGPE